MLSTAVYPGKCLNIFNVKSARNVLREKGADKFIRELDTQVI